MHRSPPALASAQDPRPEVQAIRLAETDTIVLDGAPDEAVWLTTVPATNFLQRDPANGQPATERTEVRVVFDRDRIILGVTCFDSEPDRLLGNQMQRDQPFSSDDRFMWAIDPFLDGRSGYFFEINDVDLPEGAFTTQLYRLDARTQFSPWISLFNNVQYDSESGTVGWQLRFRWIQ